MTNVIRFPLGATREGANREKRVELVFALYDIDMKVGLSVGESYWTPARKFKETKRVNPSPRQSHP